MGVRSRFLHFGLTGLLLLSVACSGEEGMGADPAPDQERRFGLISASYEHDWRVGQGTAQLSTTAQFVRYSAVDQAQVARILALPLDPGRDLPAVDRCKLYDLTITAQAESDPAAEEPGYVELLEAGDLKVEAAGSHVMLQPRHFPGLLPFVSGVVYGEAQTTMLREVERIKASSPGAEMVGPFAVQAPSPRLPRLLRIAGSSPTNLVALEPETGLELQWQVNARGDHQVTYLELLTNRGGHDLALRCQLLDDGQFTIPAPALAPLSGQVSLELSRVSSTPFETEGLAQGELRLTVKDTAAVLLPTR